MKSNPRHLKFTKINLDRLLRSCPNKQYLIWEEDGQNGLHVLVSPYHQRATVTWRVCYYMKQTAPGVPRYKSLGRYPGGDIRYEGTIYKCKDVNAMREVAGLIRAAARRGIDPIKDREASTRLSNIVADFIAKHVSKNRSARETKRLFDVYVLPSWSDLEIKAIDRGHVTRLLDKIEAKQLRHPQTKELIGGLVTADMVLAALSKLFNWYALRDTKFVNPIVRGMQRAGSPRERARQRVISDDELRLMWPLLSDMGVFGAAVQCMLLTAQRARKVGAMRRSEIISNVRAEDIVIPQVWDAARDDDPKNKEVSQVPLPRIVREIVASVPVIEAGHKAKDYVFSVNGETPFSNWSRAKDQLDRKLLAALRAENPAATLKPWQLRDLRRTARTIMSRAGVPLDTAERCLGHSMPNIRETYDRHSYLAEKIDAFDRLAAHVARIVNSRKDLALS